VSLQLLPPAPVVIFVTGELDIANAPAIEAALLGAEASGAAEIVLDLSRLEFMGSVGLRVILDADARAKAGSHRLTLRVSSAVLRITDLTGITAELPIAA
jgi:anti-sigma B factor antagonist